MNKRHNFIKARQNRERRMWVPQKFVRRLYTSFTVFLFIADLFIMYVNNIWQNSFPFNDTLAVLRLTYSYKHYQTRLLRETPVHSWGLFSPVPFPLPRCVAVIYQLVIYLQRTHTAVRVKNRGSWRGSLLNPIIFLKPKTTWMLLIDTCIYHINIHVVNKEYTLRAKNKMWDIHK